jgi:hypothetical protein
MTRLNTIVSDDEEPTNSLRIYKDRIVRFKDSFLFRNHYVRIFFAYLIFSVMSLNCSEKVCIVI